MQRCWSSLRSSLVERGAVSALYILHVSIETLLLVGCEAGLPIGLRRLRRSRPIASWLQLEVFTGTQVLPRVTVAACGLLLDLLLGDLPHPLVKFLNESVLRVLMLQALHVRHGAVAILAGR